MTSTKSSLLVVDDNELNRDMLSRRLERKGYVVTLASDGRLALDLIAKTPFDLVLLDVMMPDINGLEVLKTLRQTHSATKLPVIMVTAKDQSEDIVEALKLGASDYVTKPIDFPVVNARIETQLALKRAVDEISRLEQDLARRNEDLETANARMRRDLAAAARVQQALLPPTAPVENEVAFAWAYRPCDELAGDLLNIVRFDERRVGLYVLDVSGHGVAAALLSVAITQVLTPHPDGYSILSRRGWGAGQPTLTPPGRVAEELNKLFPFNPATEQFFTLLYGILNLDTREFHFVSAGHPGPVHVPKDGQPIIHEANGLPIGIGDGPYDEHVLRLQPGERIFLYSDGLPEAMNKDSKQFGAVNLLGAAAQGRALPLAESVSAMIQAAELWCGTAPAHDDITLLAFELTN